MAESNLTRVNQTLDELKNDLERMFRMLECDPKYVDTASSLRCCYVVTASS